MSENLDDEKLSIQQVQNLLGVARRTVYNYSKKGLLRIDHDDDGKPYVLRSQADMVLIKKDAQVRKTKYIPDGHIVVKEDAYNASIKQLTDLTAQRQLYIEHKEMHEADLERIEELEKELERVKSRGFFARLINKGVAQ